MVRFKVGDTVRAVKGEDGDCLRRYIGSPPYKVIAANGEYTHILDAIGHDSGSWFSRRFELDLPVRPQAGEYWRQRDGKVVGPLKVHERTSVLYVGGSVVTLPRWHATGAYTIDFEHGNDLVEKAEICGHCHQPIAAPCVEKGE